MKYVEYWIYIEYYWTIHGEMIESKAFVNRFRKKGRKTFPSKKVKWEI